MSLPYFKWFPTDYDDYAYVRLTDEEFGIVIRIFNEMWKSKMTLPNDDQIISRRFNLPLDKWLPLKAKALKERIFYIQDNKLLNQDLRTKFTGAEEYSLAQKIKRLQKKKLK